MSRDWREAPDPALCMPAGKAFASGRALHRTARSPPHPRPHARRRRRRDDQEDCDGAGVWHLRRGRDAARMQRGGGEPGRLPEGARDLRAQARQRRAIPRTGSAPDVAAGSATLLAGRAGAWVPTDPAQGRRGRPPARPSLLPSLPRPPPTHARSLGERWYYPRNRPLCHPPRSVGTRALLCTCSMSRL